MQENQRAERHKTVWVLVDTPCFDDRQDLTEYLEVGYLVNIKLYSILALGTLLEQAKNKPPEALIITPSFVTELRDFALTTDTQTIKELKYMLFLVSVGIRNKIFILANENELPDYLAGTIKNHFRSKTTLLPGTPLKTAIAKVAQDPLLNAVPAIKQTSRRHK